MGMCTNVKNHLETACIAELGEANSKFPLFNSAHEGHSCIREELEKMVEEAENVDESFADFWGFVKADETAYAINAAKSMDKILEKLIQEATQARAMCKKFVMSIEPGVDSKNGN